MLPSGVDTLIYVLAALFAEAGSPCWDVGEVTEGQGIVVVA